MIVRDRKGNVYDLRVLETPPKDATYVSVTVEAEDVMHPYFFQWFIEKIGPRMVHRHQQNLKEYP